MKESDWERLLYGLNTGDCTPFLGAGMCGGVLPTGRELSERWADLVDYPFDNRTSLPDVMDYAAIALGDRTFVKQQVIEMLTGCGAPDFADPLEPHALLARFPLSVYLTTNYDGFMQQALELGGKEPQVVTCPWYLRPDEMADYDGEDLEPEEQKPVVFHLHGNAATRRSLVLTKSDYVEFLTELTKDYAADDRKLIPVALRPWMTDTPLLFIGYSLEDWTFNVVFQGLLKTVAEVQRRRHISVQLPPPNLPPDRRQRAQDYLNNYFDQWKITVYWGTVSDFCAALRHRMGWD